MNLVIRYYTAKNFDFSLRNITPSNILPDNFSDEIITQSVVYSFEVERNASMFFVFQINRIRHLFYNA